LYSGALRAQESLAVDEIIDGVLRAYGGVAAISEVTSYRQDGMLVARSGAGHGEVTRISSGVGTLSVLNRYPSRREIRIVEDGRGWRGSSVGSMAEVQGPLRLAMMAQAARARVPSLLIDLRSAVTLGDPVEGHPVLEVSVADNLVLRLFVDPEAMYIVRSESLLTDMPAPIGFATDYSDFRDVDGVVFAFHEETFASGVHTASMVLGSVELNPEGGRARLPAG
jgi:hypothetical protein